MLSREMHPTRWKSSQARRRDYGVELMCNKELRCGSFQEVESMVDWEIELIPSSQVVLARQKKSCLKILESLRLCYTQRRRHQLLCVKAQWHDGSDWLKLYDFVLDNDDWGYAIVAFWPTVCCRGTLSWHKENYWGLREYKTSLHFRPTVEAILKFQKEGILCKQFNYF